MRNFITQVLGSKMRRLAGASSEGSATLLRKPFLSGFTLIELLVVVLIIGILSAVALPQYQVTMEKTHMTTVLPFLKAMKISLELFYLSNGSYPADLSEVDLPGSCTLGTTGNTFVMYGEKLKNSIQQPGCVSRKPRRESDVTTVFFSYCKSCGLGSLRRIREFGYASGM